MWTFGSQKSRRLVPEVPVLSDLATALLHTFAHRKSRQESGVLGVGSPNALGLSQLACHVCRESRRKPEVPATAESSDDMRASLVDCLREQYFYVEPKVSTICVGTSDSDLNGWICL